MDGRWSPWDSLASEWVWTEIKRAEENDSEKPVTHEDTAVREDPDEGVVLVHDLFAGVKVVPEEGVRGPDTVPAGQREVGGGLVSSTMVKWQSNTYTDKVSQFSKHWLLFLYI